MKTVLCLLLTGCLVHPIQQTTVTQLREQDALVMAPEAPMGVGAGLPEGGSSLSVGGAFTSVRPPGEDDGSEVLPLAGLLRGASGAGDRLEVTASGSLASPDVEAGPHVPGVEGLSGVLGRGTVGLRTFLPLEGPIDWAWSFDIGAEATHLTRTDTVTTEHRDRRTGLEVMQDVQKTHAVRVHPHTRIGTVVRAPLPGGITAFGGMQLQTWPTYWRSRSRIDTCTTYLIGGEECSTTGSVDVPPTRIVAVFTPSVGATLQAGTVAIHGLAFANAGTDAVQAVPWGAMVMLEHVVPARKITGDE